MTRDILLDIEDHSQFLAGKIDGVICDVIDAIYMPLEADDLDTLMTTLTEIRREVHALARSVEYERRCQREAEQVTAANDVQAAPTLQPNTRRGAKRRVT